MHRKFIAIGVIFLILISIAFYKLYGNREEGISATGTLEITRVDITPKINGYLAELKAAEGDPVLAGQTVARIARPDLDAQLLRDEAALQRAEAQLRDLVQGARTQERKEAQASLETARSVHSKTKSDYDRYLSLYQQGALSQQQLDAAKSSLDQAVNALDAAEQRVSLIEAGTRPEQIAAQQKEVERNRAILEASRTLLDDTALNSPIAGIVLSKNFENGEYINPGSPVFTVGNLNDCWVKIYIPSTQLGLIKVGQPAKVRVDSFPDRDFQGTIKEISSKAEFTPRQSITQRERANLVFAVKVKVANPGGELKPGMPADVILK